MPKIPDDVQEIARAIRDFYACIYSMKLETPLALEELGEPFLIQSVEDIGSGVFKIFVRRNPDEEYDGALQNQASKNVSMYLADILRERGLRGSLRCSFEKSGKEPVLGYSYFLRLEDIAVYNATIRPILGEFAEHLVEFKRHLEEFKRHVVELKRHVVEFERHLADSEMRRELSLKRSVAKHNFMRTFLTRETIDYVLNDHMGDHGGDIHRYHEECNSRLIEILEDVATHLSASKYMSGRVDGLTQVFSSAEVDSIVRELFVLYARRQIQLLERYGFDPQSAFFGVEDCEKAWGHYQKEIAPELELAWAA